MDLWGCAHSASFTEKKAEKVRWDYRSVSLYMYFTGLAVHVLYGVWAATGHGRGLVGLDGCEVRLCDPCARVSRVCPGSPTAPPGVFLPVRYLYPFHTDTMYRYR